MTNVASSLSFVSGYCEQCFSNALMPSASAGAPLPPLDWPASPHPPISFHDELLLMKTRVPWPPLDAALWVGDGDDVEVFGVEPPWPIGCNCSRAGAAPSSVIANRAANIPASAVSG